MKKTYSLRSSIINLCFDYLVDYNLLYQAVDILTLDFEFDGKVREINDNADEKLTKIFQWILINGVQKNLYEIYKLHENTLFVYQKLEFLKKFLDCYRYFMVRKSFGNSFDINLLKIFL